MKLKKVWNRRAAGGDTKGPLGADAEATGVRAIAPRRPRFLEPSSSPTAAETTGEVAFDRYGVEAAGAERRSWLASREEDDDRTSSVVERAPLLRADAERATTLVLMEAGACWPAWVKDLQHRAPNSMVEVQPSSESSQSFSDRVRRRLASLRQRGVTLVGAAYAAASPASEEERETRRALCAALLEHLSPDGELVLSGTGWSTWGVDARSREELMGLAGDLSCSLKGSAQTVSVRFSDPLEESGVHKAPRLAAPRLADGLQGGSQGRGARESA